MCKQVVELYHHHREKPDAYYLGFNYGTMEFDWEGGEGKDVKFVVRVHGDEGQTVLEVDREVSSGSGSRDYVIGEPFISRLAFRDPIFLMGMAGLGVLVAVWTIVSASLLAKKEKAA